MVQISENFSTLVDLDPVLTEIFYQKYNELPNQMERVFRVMGSTKAKETDLMIGGFRDPKEFNGTVEYQTITPDYDITYTHRHYTDGFSVTQVMLEDQQYEQIFSRPQEMGTAFARFREKQAWSVFNYAFSTTYADGSSSLGYDGKALCAYDHPQKEGSPTDVDNLRTAALTHSELNAAINQLAALKDSENQEISLMGNLLITGRGLRTTARELVESELTPESAENAINVNAGMRYMTVPHITSTTAWFVVDAEMSKRWLKWYDRVPVQFAAEDDFNTLQRNFRARVRNSFGWSNFRFVVGSAGA